MQITKRLIKVNSPFIILMSLWMFFIGCREPQTEFDKINNWIYREMDYWYLWTDELPEKPATNTDPESFFYDLRVAQDRFSFISKDYQELINFLNGIQLESGFEYRLYYETGSSTLVFFLLTYIKSGSPADEAGLKRGDIIYEVNGKRVTIDNYSNLISEDLNSPYEARYRRYDFENEKFTDQGLLEITPVSFAENPLLLDTIYQIEGRNIGYLIYTFFSPGPNDESPIYDEQMDNVFNEFKSKGIDEFILDLRFNNGGSEISAQNLASLMVKNATGEDLMYRKQYNDRIQENILNDEDLGTDFLNITFREKTQNIGSNLNQRVHVITSDRSASASEVVINSLKPYMDVFIVGDTTSGKDVGSITINEDNNPDNAWAIQPIIVKIVNADNQDYPLGFAPDILLESRSFILLPLGDINEPLLSTTLGAIGVQAARFSPPDIHAAQDALFESLDMKARKRSLKLDKEVWELIP